MYMEYITATQLRTKVPEVIKALLKGYKLNIIHRSKVIGIIIPKPSFEEKPINSKKLISSLKSIEPKSKFHIKNC